MRHADTLFVVCVCTISCASNAEILRPSQESVEVANPFRVEATTTLAARYRFHDDSLRIQFDGQDIARTPIPLRSGTAVPPGSYSLYVRVNDDTRAPGRRNLEVGLGDGLAMLEYVVPSNRSWIGPVHITTGIPAKTIDVRGYGEVRLFDFWLDDESGRDEAQLRPLRANLGGQTEILWIDLLDRDDTLGWVTDDQPVTLRIRSSPITHRTARIDCRVLDFEHTEVGHHAFEVPLNGILRKEVIPVPRRFGPYLVACTVDGTSRWQLSLARVANPYVMHSPLLGVHASGRLPSLLGAGWNRKWDSGGTHLLWRNVEPRPGAFSVSCIPPSAQRQLGVLDSPPAWADAGDDDAWFAYVRRVVHENKGCVDAWEIFNEPYGEPIEGWAGAHAARVTATATLIRSEDPSAVVLSGGPPSEVSPGIRWWERLADAGLFKALDVISVHMYFGRGGMHPLDTDLQFHEYARWLRALLDSHGARAKPIWDTESGIGPNETFYVDRPVAYGYWNHNGFHSSEPVPYRVGAAMAARMFVVHAWHRMPWFHYQGAPSYGNHLALVDFDGSPLPLAVALAHSVRYLDGAAPDGELELPPGCWGLRFRKRDESIVVLWAVKIPAGSLRKIDVAPSTHVRWEDMFGNPLPGAPRQLTMEPVYASGPTQDVRHVIADLRLVP